MKHGKVPGHLDQATKAWFRRMLRAFDFVDPHGHELLVVAAECLQRLRGAEAILLQEGLCVTNRLGEQRAHPAVGIRDRAEVNLCRILRELRLDPPPKEARIPRLGEKHD